MENVSQAPSQNPNPAATQPAVTPDTPAQQTPAAPQAPTPGQQTTPATQAAPQAPTQQPPTQQPTQTEVTLSEPVKYKHEPTGNAAYDIAMNAFAEKGFSPDHPAFLPASKGDFTALEAFAKERGIDSQYVTLAKQAYEQINEHHQKVHGETIKKALEIAGGEERWSKIRAWVQEVGDPEEIKYYREQLEAGGVATIKAMEYLSGLYGQHVENAPPKPGDKPSDPFNPNASPQIATHGAPLSPQEFRAAMIELIDKVGYSGLEKSAEYKALQQRRQAWRG